MGRTVPAVASATRVVRCAIYTRKSTEEGLEQAFNSLDAQREACAAYIASQRHEGWVMSPELYDDGGFSGGNMDRPGLQQLLADVEAGRVDVIVVYKVDRLTRALGDFAKIVEVLDAMGASFVSVTQSFNTTTSMGRLTLNVLLSFAQFEREVTGERIRDKIAASKKKGMWMGGPVPLGYVVTDRQLVADPGEAATVVGIFRRYVAVGSIRDLALALAHDRIVTKRRAMRDGRVTGGTPFGRGGLVHLLRNAVYIGEVHHQGSVYDGEHEAIIECALWYQVQALLDDNSIDRAVATNARHPSLLAGLLDDGHGRRMTPTHANKGPKRFRYYITHDDALRDDPRPQWRLPAHDLEHIVVARLTTWLAAVAETIVARHPGVDAATLQAARAAAATMAADLGDTSPTQQQATIRQLIERVTVTDTQVAITVRLAAVLANDLQSSASAPLVITAAAARVRRGGDVRLIMDGAAPATNRDDRLIALMAEARAANAALLASPATTLEMLADRQGRSRKHLSKLIRLAYLAPDIVTRVVDGTQPASLTRTLLLAASEIPLDWAEQRAMLGFTAHP